MRALCLIMVCLLLGGASCSDQRPTVSRTISDNQMAKLKLLVGVKNLQNGKIDRALQQMHDAIGLDPSLHNAYQIRGTIWLIKEKPDQAINDFTKAIDIKADNPKAYNGRGAAHVMAGNDAKSFADFNTAIEQNPGLAGPFSNRGNYWIRSSNYDNALSDLNTAIRLAPKNPFYRSYRATVHTFQGAYTEAVKDLNRAIEINPNLAGAHSRMGIIAFLKGDLKLAISAFDTSIRHSPKRWATYLLRARVWFLEGQYGDALEDLRRAMRIAPNNQELPLWYYVFATRSGDDALDFLRSKSASKDPAKFPAPVYAMLLGTATPAQTLTAGKSLPPGSDARKQCKVNYFAGQRMLIEKKRKQAIQYFQHAVQTNERSADCFPDALAELQRLGVANQQADSTSRRPDTGLDG